MKCNKCKTTVSQLTQVKGAIGRYRHQCTPCSNKSVREQHKANKLISNEKIRLEAMIYEPALCMLIS